MRRWYFLIAIFIFCCNVFYAQFNFDTIFNSNTLLKKISLTPDKYHLQIIYTQINYENDKPVFTSYFYNTKPENYFYCASLIKLPTSILALKKLNELRISANTIMFTDSSAACHKQINKDTTSLNKYPSIEHYIKKMLLVSDNEAFSRAYEFLGVDYIHQNLTDMGFPDVRIINRYDGNCLGKDNFRTNPVTFYDADLKVIYQQKEQISDKSYPHPLRNVSVGKAYVDSKNKKINSPKNFTAMNYMTLTDCHNILLELIYDQNPKFNIDENQRQFLMDYLSFFPRQSVYPKYDTKTYYDSYKKYLMLGDSKNPISDTAIIITNIVGQSYGFMADCARIQDKRNKIEFILSAVIYANEDEIINDGKYEYKTIALPYLAELGKQFYNYELKRNKNK